MKPLKGRGEAVLYLDFDGTLHHEAVYREPGGRPSLRAPARYTLFQHADLLDQMLAPHPGIAIVLSTSWVRNYGIRNAVKELPAGLRNRVVGSTYDSQAPGDHFDYLPRGEQVATDVERRRPAEWLALDDDPLGWPDWAQPHLVLTDPYEGISRRSWPKKCADGLRSSRARLCPRALRPSSHPTQGEKQWQFGKSIPSTTGPM